MRLERRLRGRNGMGGVSRPAPQPFWRESDKSWEREGQALASKSLLPFIGPPPSIQLSLRRLPPARRRRSDRLCRRWRELSTVLVGENGTGKSNVIEAIVEIFRDLDFGDRTRFPFAIAYNCDGHRIEIDSGIT